MQDPVVPSSVFDRGFFENSASDVLSLFAEIANEEEEAVAVATWKAQQMEISLTLKHPETAGESGREEARSHQSNSRVIVGQTLGKNTKKELSAEKTATAVPAAIAKATEVDLDATSEAARSICKVEDDRQITTLRTPVTDDNKLVTYPVGKRVKVQYHKGDTWYNGKISTVNTDASVSYDITYDDGDTESGVSAECIREIANEFEVGTRVESRFQGGAQFFPGVVTAITEDGECYDVKYDDGDFESAVHSAFLKKSSAYE